MTDGKKGQEYQRVASDVAFTTDGRPVYLATANSKQFIIVGDQEYGPYIGVQPQGPGGVINSAAMSAAPVVISGNHVAFIAMESGAQGANRVVVVDGKPIKSVSPDGLAFSPDGSHFAYTEGQSTRSVVVDGGDRYPHPSRTRRATSPHNSCSVRTANISRSLHSAVRRMRSRSMTACSRPTHWPATTSPSRPMESIWCGWEGEAGIGFASTSMASRCSNPISRRRRGSRRDMVEHGGRRSSYVPCAGWGGAQAIPGDAGEQQYRGEEEVSLSSEL